MMARYHINPETQRPNICTATGKRGCKYAVNGQEPEHYSTKEEAQLAISEKAAREHDTFTTLSKTRKDNYGRIPGHKLTELKSQFPKKPHAPSNEEANANIQRMMEERERMMEELPENEHYALGYYAMSGHRDINGYLRHGDIKQYYDRDIYEGREDEKQHITDLVKNRIKTLDHLMEKHGKGDGVEPRILYRFIQVPEGETPESFSEQLTSQGDVVDKGFTSTTEDPSFIHSHVTQKNRRKNQYVVMEILTSQGISMQERAQRQGNVQSLEQERLLPRNMRLTPVGKGAKTFSTADDRVELIKNYSPYFHDPDRVPPPPKPRRLHCIQLVDTMLLEEDEKK